MEGFHELGKEVFKKESDVLKVSRKRRWWETMERKQ